MNIGTDNRRERKHKKYRILEWVSGWSLWKNKSLLLAIKYVYNNVLYQLDFKNFFAFLYRTVFNNNVNLKRYHFWETFSGFWFRLMPITLFIIFTFIFIFTDFDWWLRCLSLLSFLIIWIICRANCLHLFQWYLPAGHRRSRELMKKDLQRSNKYLVRTPLRKHYILRRARNSIKIRSVEPYRLWHVGQTTFFDWNFLPPTPLNWQWNKSLNILTNSTFTLYHHKSYYKPNLVVNPICFHEEDQLTLKNYIIKNNLLIYYEKEFLAQKFIQTGGFVDIRKIYSSYYVYDNMTGNQVVLACHTLCWTNKLGVTYPILALGPWFIDISMRKPWYVLLDMKVFIEAFQVGHRITSDVDKLRINSFKREALIGHGSAEQLPYRPRDLSDWEFELREKVYKYYRKLLNIITKKWPKAFKKYYNKKKLYIKKSFIFFLTSRYLLIWDYLQFLQSSDFINTKLLNFRKNLLILRKNVLRFKRRLFVFYSSVFRSILTHYILKFEYFLDLKLAWSIKEYYIILGLYDLRIWYEKKISNNWLRLKVFLIYYFFLIYYPLRFDYRKLYKSIKKFVLNKIYKKFVLNKLYKPIAKYLFNYVDVRLVFLLEEKQNFKNFVSKKYTELSNPIWKFIKKYFYTNFVQKIHILYSAVFFDRFVYFWRKELPSILSKTVFPGIKYFFFKFIPLFFNDFIRIIPIVLFELFHFIPIWVQNLRSLNSIKKFDFNLNKSLFRLPTPQALWNIRTKEEFSNAFLFRARRRILGNFKSNRTLAQQKLLFQAQYFSYTNIWSNLTYDSLVYEAATFNFRRLTPTATQRREIGNLEIVEAFLSKNTMLDLNKYTILPEPYSITSFAMHGALRYDLCLHYPYSKPLVDCRKELYEPMRIDPLIQVPYYPIRKKSFDRVNFYVRWNKNIYNFVLMSAFKPKVLSQEEFSKLYNSIISQFSTILDKRNYYQSVFYFKISVDLRYTNNLLKTYINNIILVHTKKNVKIRNSKFTRRKQQKKYYQLLILQQAYINDHHYLLFLIYKIEVELVKPLVFASSTHLFRSISIFYKSPLSTFNCY